MARKLSLSPTPSVVEQLSFPEIDAREPPREGTSGGFRPADTPRNPRSTTDSGVRPRDAPAHPQPPRPWRLPRAVEFLDEIVVCAIIVLIFLTIALPLFRWIAR